VFDVYLVHQAIDQGATLQPDREAIRFRGERLTYGALQTRANQLARTLGDLGVARHDRVGIYLYKSVEMAVAIYGIMKAGAAFVPLDPLVPQERLNFMLQDCGIEVVISEPRKKREVAAAAGVTPLRAVIGLDEHGAPAADAGLQIITWSAVAQQPDVQPPITVMEQDLAYIMYTSGSTGQPKGMMHTHRSSLGFARWGARLYAMTPEDRVASHAPLHFDLSVVDFFSTALAGGTVVMVPEPVTKFPASFSQFIDDEQLTIIFTVPYALIQLLLYGALEERNLGSLRWVLFGGEPYPTGHLRALMERLPWARFSNVFGPAETPACFNFEVPPLPAPTPDPLPIGRPSTNRDILVVDEDDNPVPAGAPGELLVRGPSITPGYWQRPELNARAFLRVTLFDRFDLVYFRTGDLVQQLPDGSYRFIGRKDRMVKTRGYRVELDEVEAALVSHPAVEEAAVFAIPDGSGSNAVHAAVVLRDGFTTAICDLKAHLSGKLPRYAHPADLTIRGSFPRTTSDKIDRHALRQEALSPNPEL